MDVELRHLRYFVAVAEEGSFTRAAERLHMAQPPLSTQIRALEGAMGVELFDRSRRAIALTPAGETLLDEARRLLVHTDQVLAAARRAGTGETGRLTVGFVPSASTSVLPQHLRAFRERYPGVELFLRELGPDDLVAGLRTGGVDVSVLYDAVTDDRTTVRVIDREPLVAALPDGHALAARRDLALADLRDEAFVLPARHHMPGLHARVLEACADAGFAPTAVQKEVWLLQTILGLVAAGLGVALVPASVRRLGREGVAYREIRDAGSPVELAAAWRAGDTSPVVRNFVALLGASGDGPAGTVTG